MPSNIIQWCSSNPPNLNNKPYKPHKCYKCNKIGHYKNECPEFKCYRCNKIGHYKNECPNFYPPGHESAKYGNRRVKEYECRRCYFGYTASWGPCECY